MLDKIFYFIMVPMVYLAVLLFLIGVIYTLVRVAWAPKQPYTLQIFPKRKRSGLQAIKDTLFSPNLWRENKLFWLFFILYHVAFLLLILGHLDLIPGIRLVDPESRHMLGNGAVGVVLIISAFYFLLRRFRSPVRQISSTGDYLILLLLLLIFLTGGIISWSNSWGENGFVLEKADFANYMKILVNFTFENPHSQLESSHYFHVVFHVLLANIFIMVFPFTKFVHTFFAMVLNRIRRG